MIKQELAKDPNLKNESWDRFLPKFKSKNISKRKKPKNITIKKEYNPFPPAQIESKLDKQIESGEYFVQLQKEKAEKMKKNIELNKRDKGLPTTSNMSGGKSNIGDKKRKGAEGFDQKNNKKFKNNSSKKSEDSFKNKKNFKSNKKSNAGDSD